MLTPITLKILNERLKDLKQIQTRHQSTEVLSDILETEAAIKELITEAAINELTSEKHKTCDGCKYHRVFGAPYTEHECLHEKYCQREFIDYYEPKD